jgi:Rrf2 family protein
MAVMQIPRRVDYGLRAAIYLSMQEPKRRCSLAEIAGQQGIPRKFLEKIIQNLIQRGLVKSKRGVNGGYNLARPPEEISFQDVIEALEGPIAVNVCMNPHASCDHFSRCTMVGVWSEVQTRITEVFHRTTLADLKQVRCAGLPTGSSLSSAA